MKIIIVKTSMGIGGIERSLIEFLRHLDYSQYCVDLLLLYGPFDLCNEINSHVNLINVEALGWRIRIRPVYILWYLLSFLCRLFRRNEYATFFKEKKKDYFYKKIYSLYCQEKYAVAIAYQQSFACEYVAKYVNAGKKIMMYHHGEIEDADYLCPWFKQADIVLTVAKGVDEKLIHAFPFLKGKTRVIQNYEDAETIRAMADEYVPELTEDVVKLCTCGRLSPEKGFDLAIETAMILQQRGIKFHWYFVGNGYQQDYVETIFQKIKTSHLESSITITGFLSNPFPYIKHCDILVVPSRFEANPMIIHEGKILQKPIVATMTSGAMDLLQNKINGIICDISAEGIAQGILSLVSAQDLCERLTTELSNNDFLSSRKEYYAQWDELLAN